MPRTTATRLPEKMSGDRAELERLLAEVVVGHVGLVDEDGHPVVIPTAVVLDSDRLLLHGSSGSRWMRRLATGAPVSVTVTAIDGVVVARTAFESSLSYRSAVFFGSCRPVSAEGQVEALAVITERLVPGRVAEVRGSTRRELAATLVLELPLTDWSLRVSAGPPTDEPEDVAGPAWAGNLAIQRRYASPTPSPDLRPGIPVPESVRVMAARTPRV
ncbi:pyridoxamine 5'-phosphate oxidase family protein [Nostocoides sp. F2B08]|uniref:pyridoxamine 5'-phosphate oxidase family protein n=1 Tax=Nostocoides sp. F2B08 TaxID=2653936 RepID=UPI001262F68F|nr:pyridoxamine 5'-phosphate oxidase family protein [Tetrasphaera sp. F2B08]KAB7745334.1 pyridoxamine 5'-phosphate oxidase family protein [Tetrasphaera sp. F2B08]